MEHNLGRQRREDRRKSRRRHIESMIESLDEVSIDVEFDKEKQNRYLLKYQSLIENNARNNSITKKVLTQSLALDLLNLRTDSNDGLGNCIYVNVINLNSKYPFAVSSDCYNTFASFFGEIIDEIHGDPQKEDNIIPEFGCFDKYLLFDLNNISRKRSRVLYTEICIRRNLENIPFSPLINKFQRENVISKITEKLKNLLINERIEEGLDCEEVSFVPIEWENKMESEKDFLDECGAMNRYPEDRETLVFKDKINIYEGCILNFDDHIQYIVSSNDGRLGLLFSRIYRFLTHESMIDINYTAHPVFGHLTLSPAHIGTGMNIRIIAKFPFISRLADANSVISEYNCTVENESKLEWTGLLILTNIKTFSISEENILKDIIMAFNKLCHLEDELELTTAMSMQDDSMSSENLYNIYHNIKISETKTYTKKFLTENIVKQYQGLKTNFGSTLNNCIRHNALFPRSLFPRACDSNCYLKFSKFFDPIILESNKAKSFCHKKHSFFGSTTIDKKYQIRHPNILSFRVRFCRNFENFPFPMMMSMKDRANVERIMNHVFEDLPVELEGNYYSIKSIKRSIYYEEIVNNRLTPNFAGVDLSAGFYRDWPKHRGIFICKKNIKYKDIMLVIIVNVFDHFKVIAIDSNGTHLDICYERAICMMKFLNLKFGRVYAKKSDYGFLTSFPSSVGCGMRVSALLKLKYLGDKREKLEKECINLQMVYRGTKGRGTVAEKNVFDLSFKRNLNVSEQYILMIFVQNLKELLILEKEFDARIPMPTNDYQFYGSDDNNMDSDCMESNDFISEDLNSVHSYLTTSDEDKTVSININK